MSKKKQNMRTNLCEIDLAKLLRDLSIFLFLLSSVNETVKQTHNDGGVYISPMGEQELIYLLYM